MAIPRVKSRMFGVGQMASSGHVVSSTRCLGGLERQALRVLSPYRPPGRDLPYTVTPWIWWSMQSPGPRLEGVFSRSHDDETKKRTTRLVFNREARSSQLPNAGSRNAAAVRDN